MTSRLAEPARTGRRGEGGSALRPLLSPRLLCRGLLCRVLRRGRGTGQFLAADPDGGDRDEHGEQPDPRGDQEPTGEAGRQGVIVDGRRGEVSGFGKDLVDDACVKKPITEFTRD